MLVVFDTSVHRFSGQVSTLQWVARWCIKPLDDVQIATRAVLAVERAGKGLGNLIHDGPSDLTKLAAVLHSIMWRPRLPKWLELLLPWDRRSCSLAKHPSRKRVFLYCKSSASAACFV